MRAQSREVYVEGDDVLFVVVEAVVRAIVAAREDRRGPPL